MLFMVSIKTCFAKSSMQIIFPCAPGIMREEGKEEKKKKMNETFIKEVR